MPRTLPKTHIQVTYPVKGHVSTVLENVVVGMAQDPDIPMAGTSLGTEALQGMLRVGGVASKRLIDLQKSVPHQPRERDCLTSLYTMT